MIFEEFISILMSEGLNCLDWHWILQMGVGSNWGFRCEYIGINHIRYLSVFDIVVINDLLWNKSTANSYCKHRQMLRLDILWLWKQGLESKDQTRYAEMEEDCRQKKSNLTPAPRGREEVFIKIFLDLSIYLFSSLENLSALSRLFTGAKEGTLAKVKMWRNCCR